MTINRTKHFQENKINYFVFLFILLTQFFCLLISKIPIDAYIFLILIIIFFCISCIFTGIIIYINPIELLKKKNLIWLLFLALLICIYIPTLISNYFFHDDYLYFQGKYNNILNVGISLGREVSYLFIDLFNFITVDKSYILRTISFMSIILIYLILFRWFQENNLNDLISSIFSFLLCSSLPIMNISSYNVMFFYLWGSLFSIISAIFFIEFFVHIHNNKYLILSYLIIAFISQLLSLFIYQAISTSGLLVIIIYLLYSNNNITSTITSFLYYLFHGFVSIFYYLINNLIWNFFPFQPSGRTQLINSFSDIVSKIQWFTTEIIPQSLFQVIYSLGGDQLFISKNSFSYLYFNNKSINIYFYFFIAIIFFFGLILPNLFNNHNKLNNIIRLLLIIIAIPYSYYYYIIIKENSFLSFYVSGTVLIFTILFLYSILQIKSKLNRHFSHNYFIIPIITFYIIFYIYNNSLYLYKSWVKPNDFSYSIIKDSIHYNYVDQNKIHIYGNLWYGDVDIYAISAAKIALKELGLPLEKFRITSSDNEYIIYSISNENMRSLFNNLNEDDKDFINSIYIEDYNYSFYTLNINILSDKDKSRLSIILKNSGFLPSNNDDYIIIDLRPFSLSVNQTF